MDKSTIYLLATLLALVSCTPVKHDLTDFSGKQSTEEYRLNENVWPSNYDITLTPYLLEEPGKTQFTFDGEVVITLKTTLVNINEITLHANDLSINHTETKLMTSNNVMVNIVNNGYNNETHKLTYTLEVNLVPNSEYTLYIKYLGYMRDDMAGFYRSSYIEAGMEKWLGSTQFQTTAARRAFPCFDEPKFKATFNLKMNRYSSYQPTVFNTPLVDSVSIGDYRSQDTFKQTPKMSTYLIAFIVSEFRARETGPFVNKKFGVYARPESYIETLYAFDIGQLILSKLDEYLDYGYYSVMDKMDMAAIPDFSAGAMENWGLLTYRETNLLYDEIMTTYLTKQRIAAVIAHEQAHMWFGDLVTCDWWGYTWLNEGFARYFQYFGTAMAEMQWDLELQFVVEQLQGVFQMDSQNSSHAMNHEVNSPSEASGIFDNISYNKGASIIRMMKHFIGSTNFQLALQDYLKANAFETSIPSKLYDSFQNRISPLTYNITNIMESWTSQVGYPLITVTMNDMRNKATISQSRYFLQNKNHNDNTLWQIPLTFVTKNDNSFADTTHKLLMTMATEELSLNAVNSWTIFNVQQIGYYRVNYDEDNWNLISQALKQGNHDGIHVLNRAQIVDDVLNLARSGHVQYDFALNLLDYLKTETNYIPWLSAFNGLSYLSRRITGEDYNLFGLHILELLENIYNKLGFDSKAEDSQTDVYNRANVLQWACKYGHTECISNSKSEFEKFRNSLSITYRVPVNIRSTVYCTAIKHGTSDDWDFLWWKFTQENIATEQVLILSALGCTNDEGVLRNYLNKIFSDQVRKQDKSSAFSGTYSGHDENVDRILDYVIANHSPMSESLGSYSSVASLLSGLATRFTKQSQIDKLSEFIRNNQVTLGASAVSTLNSAISSANFESFWTERYMPMISDFIRLRQGAAALPSISCVLVFIGVTIVTIYN